ncbi:hypothetical protein [Brachybacterium phenoliresistens]|uniref:Uncharacterized protein n=1 Tax=Brachybacterium phenoliresistens TaxID=396014 RepID=Z9JS99_9MICO|nr:hypothetical protein [Brachybacterium phenoliresistens]EWS80627.1 hypothetical protein BF93_02835 [Brachybacterium phenoliresistens]
MTTIEVAPDTHVSPASQDALIPLCEEFISQVRHRCQAAVRALPGVCDGELLIARLADGPEFVARVAVRSESAFTATVAELMDVIVPQAERELGQAFTSFRIDVAVAEPRHGVAGSGGAVLSII